MKKHPAILLPLTTWILNLTLISLMSLLKANEWMLRNADHPLSDRRNNDILSGRGFLLVLSSLQRRFGIFSGKMKNITNTIRRHLTHYLIYKHEKFFSFEIFFFSHLFTTLATVSNASIVCLCFVLLLCFHDHHFFTSSCVSFKKDR